MNSVSQDETVKIYDFLIDLSCCNRCIIRFLGFHISDEENAYLNPEEFLKKFMKNGNNEENTPKRIKKNPCPVCLNCFDLETLETLLENCTINANGYNYKNFSFNVSFPKCLSIRSYSMHLHLKEKFPQFNFHPLYETTGIVLEQPHKIFRFVVSSILEKALQIPFHPKSNLNLLLTISYGDDDSEVESVKKIIVRKSNKKKIENIEVSRNNIFKLLKDISSEKFRKNFSVPPLIPEKGIFIEKIDLTADPIYLAGRYLKFKRNVGQTPWVIDGVSVSEHNIQDIIFDAVCHTIGCSKESMTFCASGREDLDVRMLGTGRPFYIKIDNPKDRTISKEQLLEIEKEILKTELAAVLKLQSTYVSELNRIKLGEEEKEKTYRALCKTASPNVKEAVELINKQPADLQIIQLTPMRVLHRRTLLPREKTIHKMKAIDLPDHEGLFEVEIVTQAGTYVKEFVHGDFDRTSPSLSFIVGYSTDIVALDCVDIQLSWPEKKE